LDVGQVIISEGGIDTSERPKNRSGFVREPSEQTSPSLLLVSARSRGTGNKCIVNSLGEYWGGVDVPTAHPPGPMPQEVTPRRCRRSSRRGTDVASAIVVPHVGVDGVGPPPVIAAVTVDHQNSAGGSVLEMPVATGRLAYLRQQLQHIGHAPEDLEGIMEGVSKRGDQKAYDTPVRLFFEWAVRELGPHSIDSRTICPSIIIKYLQHLHLHGASASVLAKARSAVSATVSIATDGRVELGDSSNVKRFMAGVKQKAPVGPKKQSVPSYHDVALLYSLVWLYGPNEALSDGLLKEKLVTLLLEDQQIVIWSSSTD
jgi:hypothetical protein